jgi:succinyl-CoA synthetase alpha subunit
VGATFADLLPLFEKDPETEVVVAFGEPGTMMEEEAGRLVTQGKFTKPLVFYLAGKYVVPEVRFGHAGAIVSRGRGTVEEKADFLGQCGVVLVDHLADIGETVKRLL